MDKMVKVKFRIIAAKWRWTLRNKHLKHLEATKSVMKTYETIMPGKLNAIGRSVKKTISAILQCWQQGWWSNECPLLVLGEVGRPTGKLKNRGMALQSLCQEALMQLMNFEVRIRLWIDLSGSLCSFFLRNITCLFDYVCRYGPRRIPMRVGDLVCHPETIRFTFGPRAVL